MNLPQSLSDPATFLAGWLQGITSLWVGFDPTDAPCPHLPALAQSALALPQTS